MRSLFSPDSTIMQALSRLCDLVLMNILFLLTCLPVFTIGAASTAMYTVCFRLGTDREAGLLKSYFHSFRENFRQGCAIWGLLAVAEGLAALGIAWYAPQTGALHLLMFPCVLLLALAVLVRCYAYPLLSQFHNSVKGTMKNALLLCIGYLPRSLVAAVCNALPVAMLLYDPVLFLRLGIVWVVLYFSASAYLCTLLLRKVFAPYRDA